MRQAMGEIKFDQDAAASICRQLNTVKSGIGRESNRVNSVHAVLWADQALTNAFSASLITEIKTAARKLDKQKELLGQYHAQVQSIAEAFPDADRHKGPINRIITALLSTYLVSNTGLFGIAVLGLMGEKTVSSSSSVTGTADETGECISLYDWIFGNSKNNKTITVEVKKEYDVSGTYEKKLEAEERYRREHSVIINDSPDYRHQWDDQHFYITPPKENHEGYRYPEAYMEVLESLDVENNYRYQEAYNPFWGFSSTCCNIYVWDALVAMDCKLPSTDYLGCTEMRNWMASSAGQEAGWIAVDESTAIEMANRGFPTVAAATNTNHVGMVVPQRDGDTGVMISQAGASNYEYGPLERGFGSYNVVYFYHM